MQLAPKNKEKHTFILITDSLAEVELEFGFFSNIDLFNIPIPPNSENESVSYSKDGILRKSIFEGTIEFYDKQLKN